MIRLIQDAFPIGDLPGADDLFRDNLLLYRPFEAEGLRHEVAGKPWPDVNSDLIDSNPEWLSFFSARAFHYYLPAWLLYGIDYSHAGYAAEVTAAYLAGPDPGQKMPRHQAVQLGSLDEKQRAAVVGWLTFLVAANPEDDPGWLKQKGATVEDVAADLEALGTR